MLYEALRIPAPQISGNLSHLESEELLTSRGARHNHEWALTPEGRNQAGALIEAIDESALAAEEATAPGATFFHALHTVLAPTFAPARYTAGIARLHDGYPFERNVFCMTRLPDEAEPLPDPIAATVNRLREVADDHGLVLHVAVDRQLHDELLTNVGAYMWGSQYGLGLLEDRVGKGLNYNVIAELGSMLMTGRRCALLKDSTAPNLPTNFTGQIYKSVDLDDVDGVAAEAHHWFGEDLSLGRCTNCP